MFLIILSGFKNTEGTQMNEGKRLNVYTMKIPQAVLDNAKYNFERMLDICEVYYKENKLKHDTLNTLYLGQGYNLFEYKNNKIIPTNEYDFPVIYEGKIIDTYEVTKMDGGSFSESLGQFYTPYLEKINSENKSDAPYIFAWNNANIYAQKDDRIDKVIHLACIGPDDDLPPEADIVKALMNSGIDYTIVNILDKTETVVNDKNSTLTPLKLKASKDDCAYIRFEKDGKIKNIIKRNEIEDIINFLNGIQYRVQLSKDDIPQRLYSLEIINYKNTRIKRIHIDIYKYNIGYYVYDDKGKLINNYLPVIYQGGERIKDKWYDVKYDYNIINQLYHRIK